MPPEEPNSPSPAHGIASLTGREILAIVRHRAPLILLGGLLAGLAALGISLLQTPQYEAKASLLFRDPGFSQQFEGSQVLASGDPQRDAATNLSLVTLQSVADSTADDLNIGLSGNDIAHRVSAKPEGESDVVTLTATDTDPEVAAQIVNAFAENYIGFRQSADRMRVRRARVMIQRDLDQLSPAEKAGRVGQSLAKEVSKLRALEALQTGNAELVQRAEVPTTQASPKPVRTTAIAALLGSLLGVAITVGLERLNRRIRTPRELEDVFGVPILTTIGLNKSLAAGTAPIQELHHEAPEAFQMLRTRLRYFNVDRRIQSVLVTSPAPKDGKTTVSIRLALDAAASGLKTILIDADFHRSTVASRTGISSFPGLAEFLSGQSPLEDVIQSVDAGSTPGVNGDQPDDRRHLSIIAAGPEPPNSVELMESKRMVGLLEQLTQEYDLVVIDTPPVSRVADAIPLLRHVDGVILVGRIGVTTRDEGTHLVEQLAALDAPVLGVVANGVAAWTYRSYYGYYKEEPSSAESAEVVVHD